MTTERKKEGGEFYTEPIRREEVLAEAEWLRESVELLLNKANKRFNGVLFSITTYRNVIQTNCAKHTEAHVQVTPEII